MLSSPNCGRKLSITRKLWPKIFHHQNSTKLCMYACTVPLVPQGNPWLFRPISSRVQLEPSTTQTWINIPHDQSLSSAPHRTTNHEPRCACIILSRHHNKKIQKSEKPKNLKRLECGEDCLHVQMMDGQRIKNKKNLSTPVRMTELWWRRAGRITRMDLDAPTPHPFPSI
jgi:hypothetical protein